MNQNRTESTQYREESWEKLKGKSLRKMSINSYTIVIEDYRTIWIEHVPKDQVLIYL
jgi:hypothetical protein